jgi:hypothetical protein
VLGGVIRLPQREGLGRNPRGTPQLESIQTCPNRNLKIIIIKSSVSSRFNERREGRLSAAVLLA